MLSYLQRRRAHQTIQPYEISRCCTIKPTVPDRVDLRLSEGELGDLDGGDGPGLAVVAGRHLTGDTFALGNGVDVVGVSRVEGDLGVGPRWSTMN